MDNTNISVQLVSGVNTSAAQSNNTTLKETGDNKLGLAASVSFVVLVGCAFAFIVYRKNRKSSDFNNSEELSLTSQSSRGSRRSRMLPQHTKRTNCDVDVGFPITSNCLNTEYEVVHESI